MVWYQGEANTNKPKEYEQLLPALIADWRNNWGQGNLPFLFVQLPNFMEVSYLPSESNWAQLRSSQLKTLQVPNTAMVVTIDAGEWNDIHPLNKKVIGDRLALAAQHLAYGDHKTEYSGPIYKSVKEEGGKMILTFSHTGSGLELRDGEGLQYFAIAGADKKYVWAKVALKGDEVIVWNGTVLHPVYVRYAWADNPEGANLYNKEGLPASPFETGN
jgi:sialate O-acetylesterase